MKYSSAVLTASTFTHAKVYSDWKQILTRKAGLIGDFVTCTSPKRIDVWLWTFILGIIMSKVSVTI